MITYNKESVNCAINEYRHWVINYISSLVPKDYMVIERRNIWPANLYKLGMFCENEKEVPNSLKKYVFKWVSSELPQYFFGRAKPLWKKTDDIIDRDSTYWEVLEKRTLKKVVVKNVGWNGVIEVSHGKNSVYFLDTMRNIGNGLVPLQFVAFKNRNFFEELLTNFHYAQQENTEIKRKKVIFCLNGADIEIEKIALDRVILPSDIKSDILNSTETFYKRIDSFKGMGVPSKRGFLFTGQPGNGKTLLCFALAGYISAHYKVKVATIQINRNVDNDDIHDLYKWASNHGPAMVILEDVDTILTETAVTRSGFLNVLDGMHPDRGVLTIATTNYPEKLDPALAHRPSRFDRVWNIPIPSNSQRDIFIDKLFQTPALSKEQRKHIVHQTQGWSMAYVQELKATAVVSAVQNNRDYIDINDIDYAISRLSLQFESGKKNHRYENNVDKVGFIDTAV